MYEVRFYKDPRGHEPVLEYLRQLAAQKGKEARIKLNKIQDHIELLRQYGTYAGKPFVKHLEGDIWELRPLQDRILFAAWEDKSFILLHQFRKKSQKTPRCEIEKAKRELEDIRRRGEENGEKEQPNRK